MNIENCPFCGATGVRLELQPVYEDPSIGLETFAVHCMECDSWGPTEATIDEAISKWNRPNIPAVAKAVDRILGLDKLWRTI